MIKRVLSFFFSDKPPDTEVKMRLFRRRSPSDVDPQLTGLRFEASASTDDESGKPESGHNLDFISFEGITPKSARKLASTGGNIFN